MGEKKLYRGALLDVARFKRYKRAMPRDPNESEKYQAAIDALHVAESLDLSDSADIDKALASLARMLKRRGGLAIASKEAPASAHAPDSKLYAGLSLSEAAAKYLLSAGTAQRATKIIEALRAGGVEMSAEQPVSSLKAALQRRSNNFGDVHQVAYGTWTHQLNLTDKERAALEHKGRTKRGLLAARGRGKQIGARPKLTQEQWAEIEETLSKGKTVTEAAKQFGVSRATVALKYKRAKVMELRDAYQRKQDAEKDGAGETLKRERPKAERERIDTVPRERERPDDEDVAGKTRH